MLRRTLLKLGSLALCAAMFLLPAAASAAAALEAEIGYDGVITYVRTLPVNVRITNTGADANGVWYPTETASAMFSCKVIDKLDLDTHVLFVGKSIEAVKLSDAPVMTYDYYHKVLKGKTPPKASSYQG